MKAGSIAFQTGDGEVGSHRLARICLFGKPALFVDDRLQPFGGPRRAIALLAYLLLHRDRVLSRAAVAEQFWPDEDGENARASLRRHLHRALAALPEAPAGRPWLIADRVSLRWNPAASLDLDTSTYERLSSSGRQGAAVELYRGDYLEDFYEEWVLPERERLRGLHARNLIAVIDERRRALDYPAAIAFAESLQRLDPLREDAARRLMSLRFAAGDRSGALADFESFSRRLWDELAAEPMPETVALREAIRKNELSAHDRGKSGTPRAATTGFPFSGRAAALRALRDAWEAAAHGTPATVIVSGEAGIGKSRVIGELMALAESQGGRVLFGGTGPIEREPYQPLAEALRGGLPLLRLDRFDAVKLAALSSLIPAIRERAAGVVPLAQMEPERDRLRLFDAVQSAFENLAEKRPTLVVLEDMHWAGAATIDLVEFLTRRLGTTSVLIALSMREEDVDGNGALRGFLRRIDPKRSHRVALGPFAEADIRNLVSAVCAAGRVDEIVAELCAACGGNALFVTELLRERLQNGGGVPVPAGIAAMAATRVERLSAAARRVAETAAVLGARFDAETVRHVCGWSFAEACDALDELLDHALVRLSPHSSGDYVFSHQLIQAAVYEVVPEQARRGIHRRVARTLERLNPDRPLLFAAIARHYAAAGSLPEAVDRFVPAIRYALDVFAHDEAIALASQALALCADDRIRFELHRLAEEAAARSGDPAHRRLHCDAMRVVAERLGDDDLLGTALCRVNALCLDRYDRDEQARAIAALAALSERTASPRWTVETALARVRPEITRANYIGAERILQANEACALRLADDALSFEYWYVRAFNAAHHEPATARRFLERARSHAAADTLLALRALRAEANVAAIEGDELGRYRAATELLARYRDIGDLEGQAIAHQNLALAAEYRLGVEAYREHSAAALALYERIQKPQGTAGVLVNRGIFEQLFGNFAAAAADYSLGRSLCDRFGLAGYGCIARASQASLASFSGDPHQALALGLEALAFADDHALGRERYYALRALGVAERDLGVFERSRERLQAAIDGSRVHNPGQVLDALAEIAPVYVALGDVSAAVAAANELERGLASGGRLSFPAHAASVAAEAYAAAGELECAETLRAGARTRLRELAARIENDTARAGYLSLPVHRTIDP
jgi:DNA-binding SARP family transcriptional activator